MDFMTIISYAMQYGPAVKAIVDEATSNEDVATKLKNLSTPFFSILEYLGSQFFPKAQPALHAVAAAMTAFDPNVTKWLQGSLNNLLEPSPNLVVDGQYGPKTKAAVEQLQTQLGLTVDGWAGNLTQTAIQLALSKLTKAA